MADENKDLFELEQKEETDKPFRHRFFWFIYTGGTKHPYPDLVEFHALKLANMAKCHFVDFEIKEIENDKRKGYEYYIIAEGLKQKLMLYMMLCKAWMSGVDYQSDFQVKRYRDSK